ncbi:AcrR family transcriptional regulator [Marmoricola sp. OAE513]|uniref:TetR/AcrR family transcriptional regulator n=1 Tax=Marmoricola sp. OAE513 TaxID=2817894 RepID=UPI001AE5F292
MPAKESAQKAARRPYAARVPADVRRAQLHDAALRIIVRDGYDAISIETIAQEAGVTRPVVYGVFADLRDLLTTLLDRQQARALQQLAEVLPPSPDLSDPDRLVAETARRMIDAVRGDPMTWQPILLARTGMPEQVRARIDTDRANLTTQIAGLLELGLAIRGGPVLDPEVLAHAIVAVLEHFGRLLLAEPDLFDTDRLVATITGLLGALK